MRRWRRWALEGLVLVAIVVGVSAWQTRRLVARGEAAPPLPAAAAGKAAVVYFYAPWCGVCKLSGGNLAHLRRLWSEDELAVVPVALDYETPEEALAFAKEHGIPGEVVLGDDAVREAWKIGAYPTYYVVSADGTITGSTVGYSTTLGLVARVALAR